MYKITETALNLHGSIRGLCESGWVSSSPIIIRTQLDALANVLFIIEKDSNVRAAMYFIYGFLRMKSNAQLSKGTCDNYNEKINEVISKIESDSDKKNLEVIRNRKVGPYWFNYFGQKKYRVPSDILRARSTDEIKKAYDGFSGTSHASFIGSNLFKDEPDYIDINPRYDRDSSIDAMLLSIKITTDILKYRCDFEQLNERHWSKRLYDKSNKLKSFLKGQPAPNQI